MNRELTTLAAARNISENMSATVFDLYAPALYMYAFRLYPSATVADQVVGDILARFLERSSIGGFSRVNVRLDLYAIAYDILVRDLRYSDYFRQLKTRILKHTGQSSTDPDFEDRELADTTQRALLCNLTDDQRHVVLLRFVEGFSVKETALIMGKKVGTVKVIQNRGMAALRKALDYGAVETETIARFIRQLSYA